MIFYDLIEPRNDFQGYREVNTIDDNTENLFNQRFFWEHFQTFSTWFQIKVVLSLFKECLGPGPHTDEWTRL